MTTFDVRRLAKRVFKRHAALHPLTHYTGILSLHGYARLAAITGDPDILADCRGYLMPFVRGELEFHANFANYYCGGNATAFLYWLGELPEAEQAVHYYAEDLLHNAPRDDEGIFSMPNRPRNDLIWVDVAFAVTPFLLFAGLALDEDTYVEEGFQQIKKMYGIFRDPANGLLHQSRGFAAPGKLSEDHWSRGNGWGLLALTELVNYLPADDPRRPASEQIFADLVAACLRYQDEGGMWHQEIPDHTSYVETSGTGLILYAIGVGLEKGLLPASSRRRFEDGLAGYARYIRSDGSVYHTCRGCLCPGDGSVSAYKQRPPVLDDTHAFGPVTLAFGQAARLGIGQVVRE